MRGAAGILAVSLVLGLTACGNDEPTRTQELCEQFLEGERNGDGEALLNAVSAMVDLNAEEPVEPRIWLAATLLLQSIADGEPSDVIQVHKDLLIESCEEEVAG